MKNAVQDVRAISECILAENCLGRWLWKSGYYRYFIIIFQTKGDLKAGG